VCSKSRENRKEKIYAEQHGPGLKPVTQNHETAVTCSTVSQLFAAPGQSMLHGIGMAVVSGSP
jgi:hypothetical protein